MTSWEEMGDVGAKIAKVVEMWLAKNDKVA